MTMTVQEQIDNSLMSLGQLESLMYVLGMDDDFHTLLVEHHNDVADRLARRMKKGGIGVVPVIRCPAHRHRVDQEEKT